MDCFQVCCECCCPNGRCPCYNGNSQKKHKYPHVEYYQPSVAADVVDSPDVPYQKVPVKKIFKFVQEGREFRQHPQIGTHETVLQQPTSHDSDWDVTPLYVTERGRTLDTVSELPHHSPSATPEPPFTPPSPTPPAQLPTSCLEDTCVLYAGHDPVLQFSVYYDIQRRVLSLNLLCAFNLPGREGSEYFVCVFILPDRERICQTRNVSGNSNPMFNQKFEFQSIVAEELYEQVLVFQIFSRDKFTRDQLIGTVTVPLHEADLFGVQTVKKLGSGLELLQRFATGDILLSLRYSPLSNMLQGIVLKASNLPRPHRWGLADPYVKVYLVHKHKRMSKWKSRTKKSTLAPVFNEAFEFNITGMDPQDVNIEVFVMDHDRFRRNDVIGMVYIGPNVPSELGVAHYSEVLANPQHPISHWHKLIPHHAKTRKRHKSNTM